MSIEELERKHQDIFYETLDERYYYPDEHPKLSIKFAISMLGSMKVNMDDLYSDIFDTHVNNILKGKIQELKEYLDEKV